MRSWLRIAASLLLALALGANAQYVSAFGGEPLARTPRAGTIGVANLRSAAELAAVAPTARLHLHKRDRQDHQTFFVPPLPVAAPLGRHSATRDRRVSAAVQQGARATVRGRAPPLRLF